MTREMVSATLRYRRIPPGLVLSEETAQEGEDGEHASLHVESGESTAGGVGRVKAGGRVGAGAARAVAVAVARTVRVLVRRRRVRRVAVGYSHSAGRGARRGGCREGGSTRARYDGEVVRLGKDGAELVSALDQVNPESGASNPTAAWRVDGERRGLGAINEGSKDLRGRGKLRLVAQNNGEVGGVGVNSRPGDDVGASGCPASGVGGASDLVGEGGSGEGEEGGDRKGTHG